MVAFHAVLAQDTAARIEILKENIRQTEKNPGQVPTDDADRCDLRLVGQIGPGTAQKFRQIVEDEKNGLNSRAILLCLDSTGGEVSEALELARFIRAQDYPAAIITVVQDGAYCQSACALVFMAGSVGRLGPIPARILHPRGKLMFHSTKFHGLSKDDLALMARDPERWVRDFYVKGLRDVQEIVSTFGDSTFQAEQVGKPFVSPSLFLEAFAQGPDEWICIDNVDKVGRWDIQLSHYEQALSSSKLQYVNVCRNVYSWSRDQFAAEGPDWSDLPSPRVTSPPPTQKLGGRSRSSDYFDERFIVDGAVAMKASRCVVEVTYSKDRKRRLIDEMRVFFLYGSGDLASPMFSADASALFDPNTPLGELIPSKPAPKGPGASRSSQTLTFTRHDNRQMAGCESRRLKNVGITECEASCDRDRECYAFSYNKSARACSIKNWPTAMRLDPLWQTGIRPGIKDPEQSVRKTKMAQEAGVALQGKRLDFTEADSFEKCIEYCESEAKCLGVNYTQRCERLEGVDAQLADPNSYSAIKRQQ
jgi:ATP-dependent protease ClpP protease subunit